MNDKNQYKFQLWSKKKKMKSVTKFLYTYMQYYIALLMCINYSANNFHDLKLHQLPKKIDVPIQKAIKDARFIT